MAHDGGDQEAGQSAEDGETTADPGDNFYLESDQADAPEEEESQPQLLCTKLMATANSDEPELSEDECEENTGNGLNSPTDVASTNQITVDHTSTHNTDSNIQQEPKQPAIQRDA